MDHGGLIFVLADNKIYIFSDRHQFKNIGIYTKDKFDTETISRFTSLSPLIDFSDYKTIAALVTNGGYIFELR